MARGRQKPAEQHIREGTYRRDRVPEPLLVAGRPELNELAEPPGHLPREGQQFWSLYVVELVKCGIVDRVDVPLLEMMCVQYARAVQAGRVIAEFGHFSVGSTGQVKEHPAVKIEREATAMFWRIAESFGIGPLGRVRLGLAELHRRSLQAEIGNALGAPKLVAIGGETVEDDSS